MEWWLPAAGADNGNSNLDKIVFTIKDTKLYVQVVILSAKDYQKLWKRLTKGSQRSVCGNECIKKVENKNTRNEYMYFLNSNFLGVNRLSVLIYSSQDDNAKRFKARRYYLPKGIIEHYNVINGKNFYEQPIYYDMKWYEEIRRLTKGKVKIMSQDICWIMIQLKMIID